MTRASRSLRTIRHILVAALAYGALVAGAAADTLPRVHVLATGGTIASVQPDEADAYYRAALSGEQLVDAVPQLARVAKLTAQQVANIGSQNMSNQVWRDLAAAVRSAAADDAVDGIVITHGTDTMEETAYFLSLVIDATKPIVLVGAMRPATAPGADGPANLYDAVTVATHEGARGRGPLIVMNGEIHAARGVTKTNTLAPDTFASPDRGRIGVVQSGEARWFETAGTTRHTTRSEFAGFDAPLDEWPRVAIVYSHANFDGTPIRTLAANDYDGVVLAGVGEGNTSDPGIEAIRAAIASGVAVVRSSRVGSGFVTRRDSPDDPDSDAKIGSVAALDLNPQKARILLMLALTRTKDSAALQRYFDEY
ncbi:MAG TPA: asparaginase [Steroidobacteraceae bacterium]|nr:asparaginase [Steroidobacteraceae bacterium]